MNTAISMDLVAAGKRRAAAGVSQEDPDEDDGDDHPALEAIQTPPQFV